MISGSGADPVLVPGDLYHYPGGPQPAYPGAPPPANGYSVPVQGSGYPGSYDGPGGVDPGRYHPDSRLGGGHCNHLKDDCDCFKDDFSLPRKVRISKNCLNIWFVFTIFRFSTTKYIIIIKHVS